jgi:16S rRNA (uracil1498-N3)-methyltransferase
VHLFYQPDLTSDTLLLSEEESKHAIRVLRLEMNSQVELVDGKGTRALAEVRDDHPKRCALEIISRTTEKTGRNFHLHIAVAPTKNIERIEWFLEKATEIGIDEITLLDCEHSERSTVKTERLEKVAVSAMKQSQQSWLPVINEMQKFEHFIRNAQTDVRLIAHCEDGEKNPISKAIVRGNRILVLIGPEGDFSTEEISSAINTGFTPVSLGETRLRTETAALYAVTAINILQ